MQYLKVVEVNKLQNEISRQDLAVVGFIEQKIVEYINQLPGGVEINKADPWIQPIIQGHARSKNATWEINVFKKALMDMFSISNK